MQMTLLRLTAIQIQLWFTLRCLYVNADSYTVRYSDMLTVAMSEPQKQAVFADLSSRKQST